MLICFQISAQQIAYKRLCDILFHVNVMAFNNSLITIRNQTTVALIGQSNTRCGQLIASAG